MHLFTIGHSTRTFQELLYLLKEHGIQVLVDVQRWPSSQRHHQFNMEELKQSLKAEGIKYVWLGEELGGYRREGLGEESPNQAWNSEGFRNYADHTLTEDFKAGIESLLKYAKTQTVVYMCAEKFYGRCHRRIISDYLKARGHRITHILGKGQVREHRIPDFAEVRDGILTYP
ncbi:MAG: DUF488 family protein [Thermoproteota archaeon]